MDINTSHLSGSLFHQLFIFPVFIKNGFDSLRRQVLFTDIILSCKNLQFIGNSALGYCQVHDFCRSFLLNYVENFSYRSCNL